MKRKREERRRRRRLKLRTLFMLSLTLIFNTYAWFLYVTTVSTNMQVHVDAWSVNFEVDNQIIDKEFIFEIDQAYPGMATIEKSVSITNSGEKDAVLDYKVSILRILDQIYIVKDELSEEEKANLDGTEIEVTSEEILRMMNEDFPFKISINYSDTELGIGESATVDMSFSWAYDSGNDELDTQYGIDSYKYYQENAGQPAIQAKIKITAEQKKDAVTP